MLAVSRIPLLVLLVLVLFKLLLLMPLLSWLLTISLESGCGRRLLLSVMTHDSEMNEMGTLVGDVETLAPVVRSCSCCW